MRAYSESIRVEQENIFLFSMVEFILFNYIHHMVVLFFTCMYDLLSIKKNISCTFTIIPYYNE